MKPPGATQAAIFISGGISMIDPKTILIVLDILFRIAKEVGDDD